MNTRSRWAAKARTLGPQRPNLVEPVGGIWRPNFPFGQLRNVVPTHPQVCASLRRHGHAHPNGSRTRYISPPPPPPAEQNPRPSSTRAPFPKPREPRKLGRSDALRSPTRRGLAISGDRLPMEWTESGRTAAGVAFEFPAGEEGGSPGSSRVPGRIRRRLTENRGSSPSTAEDIHARLREADLRRQQFHAWLSSKARPKPRSPSWSSQEEDPGQRLEAKLFAAEQKRLSLLAKAQMRLARLDELRQAAKTSVEVRLEKERAKLGTKVESRVQQAEANRMLLLKAIMQRRVAARERTARSLSQRINREAKYKERVRLAISQKRAAAEKKRLVMLEAEKTRARARVMKARKIAKFVCSQREMERRNMKEQLDNRLQRAIWQRTEYLKLRGGSHSSIRANCNRYDNQGETLSRKLSIFWRRFVILKRTTLSLAKDFKALDVNENSVHAMRFEQLAACIQSATTLQIVKSLLDRLESRLMILQTPGLAQPENIDHLLKRVTTPNKRSTSAKTSQGRGKMRKGQKELKQHHETRKSLRYPVRVVLCAYMILGHPDAVFNGQGNHEKELAESAVHFIQELEMLIKVILDGPQKVVLDGQVSSSQSSTRHTFRSQLVAFDAAWRSYLYCFVAWKVNDAKLLEEDLVRAACQLELSMMQTCKMTSDRQNAELTHDMRAIQKQVIEDQRLLREMVEHLSGNAGIERMESALSDVRFRFFEARENGNSPRTPIAHMSSPLLRNSPAQSGSASKLHSLNNENRPSSVVRSLFADSSGDRSASNLPAGGAPVVENEFIVNKIFNHPDGLSTDSSTHNVDEDEKASKAQVRTTFENAFWDGILEYLTKDNPNSERTVVLVKEDHDELCEMSPAGEASIVENEFIVNEILHQPNSLPTNSSTSNIDEDVKVKAFKEQLRTTFENAFWDWILESLTKDQPDYARLICLVKEVRDELCDMSPAIMKQEIKEFIDIDVLAQLLEAGSVDLGYLGKILEYSLGILRKLSAPAKQSELEKAHLVMLSELADIARSVEGPQGSFVAAVVKGLRFVLEEVKSLKKACLATMLPIIKDILGLDYLQKTFRGCYGPPCNAASKLPLTKQWLTSLGNCFDEWHEHTGLVSTSGTNQNITVTTPLRSGGKTLLDLPTTSFPSSINRDIDECKGERFDVLLRIGLVKLVTGPEGLSKEQLPETLKLNFLRLRAVQANLQKIIVISTSMLVLRQFLLSEKIATESSDIDSKVNAGGRSLLELLERREDVGVIEIIDAIMTSCVDKNLEETREVMARVLVKSLQVKDAVFQKVLQLLYLALRLIVLGGSGVQMRGLVDITLRRIGASLLSDKVVAAAETLLTVAKISGQVHKSWYESLLQT